MHYLPLSCISDNRRRDRINSVLLRSLDKGEGGTYEGQGSPSGAWQPWAFVGCALGVYTDQDSGLSCTEVVTYRGCSGGLMWTISVHSLHAHHSVTDAPLAHSAVDGFASINDCKGDAR